MSDQKLKEGTRLGPVMPMCQRSGDGFKTRENLFVERYRKTHMTLAQISLKYSWGKQKLMLILPKPDIICPFGNHTRLWEREGITQLLGEV